MKLILEACVDVVPKEIPRGLPPMGDIIPHQIYLIPSFILLKKLAYRMSLEEDEELKRQFDDFLDKGPIRENKIPYSVIPTLLAPNKDGSWRMCVDFQPINNLFVKEKVRLDIEQRIKQYEDQVSEGYQRLVFDLGGLIWLHVSKERFLM